MKRKKQGWHNEPNRHSLASRGVRTRFRKPKGMQQGSAVDRLEVELIDEMESVGDVGTWKLKDAWDQERGMKWAKGATEVFCIPYQNEVGKPVVDVYVSFGRISGMIVKEEQPTDAVERAVEWMEKNKDFDVIEAISKGRVGNAEYESRYLGGTVYPDPSDKRKSIDTGTGKAVGLFQIAESDEKYPQKSGELVEQGLATKERRGPYYSYKLTEKGNDAYRALKKVKDDREEAIEVMFPEGVKS